MSRQSVIAPVPVGCMYKGIMSCIESNEELRRTYVPTCKGFSNWSIHFITDDILYSCNVLCRQGVLIHQCVHRRENNCRGRRCQGTKQGRLGRELFRTRLQQVTLDQTDDKIITRSMSNFGECISGARSYENEVCPASQLIKQT